MVKSHSPKKRSHRGKQFSPSEIYKKLNQFATEKIKEYKKKIRRLSRKVSRKASKKSRKVSRKVSRKSRKVSRKH